MVLIRVHRLDEERRVFLCGGVETSLEHYLYIRLQPFSAVLGTPHDVILELVGGMVEGSRLHGTGLRFAPGLIHPRVRAWSIPSIPVMTALTRGFL